MKPREMRLRLVVRRHALPETRIIFTISLEEDPSIADLIEAVNGVVPLESEDWGLEDYVAELHDEEGSGFDLLHFQRIVSVLKTDEEVFIRPLLANDRRQRRLGGRDQISNDGRHLIDGVPFGRPRFKAPRSRPSISIPPLKRRRITHDYTDDEENSDEDDDAEDDHLRHKTPAVRFDVPDNQSGRSETDWLKQLRGPEDNQEDDGQHGNDGNDPEDDNDSDFAKDADSEEDESVRSDEDDHDENNKTAEELLQELRDLQAANELIQAEERIEEEEQEQEQEQEEEQEQAQGLAAPVFDGLSAAERASLTLADLDRITALRAAFPTASVQECEKTLFDCRRKGKTAYRRLIKKHEAKMTYDDMITYFGSLRGGYLQAGTFTNDDDDAQSNASDADSVASFVKHYDRHGFPSGSILAGTAATHMAEALRKSGQLVKLPVHTRFDDGLEDPIHSEDEGAYATKTNWNGSRAGPDIDESSSDSDTGPEEESSKPAEASTSELLDVASSDSDSSDSDSSSDDDSDSDSDSSGSGSGSGKDNDDDVDVNADDDSDDDVSFQDRSDASGGDSSDDKSSSSEDSSDSGSDAESGTGAPLPSNSKSAPSSNETSGLDMPASPQLLPPVPVPTVSPGQGLTKTQRRNMRRRTANKVKRLELQHGAGADVTMADEASEDKSALAAKKAALIESLGFTPDVADGSAVASPTSAKLTAAPSARSSPAKDPEAWRHKIIYRAVECCQEGITLSEPPFPFYQRWDPHQQIKKRFSKRKQRDQTGYYEDDSQSKKKQRTQYSGHGTQEDDELWDASYFSAGQYNDSNIVLNYDDEPEAPAEDTTDAYAGQEDDEDDLPPLPTDLACLPALGPGEAKSGMILTWKQMIMSKATNWAPQVFSFRGSVIDVHDDGSLRVLLAKRDRHIDRNEKEYDEDGNRVYDKFEFPGMDDELEEELELGYRTLDPLDMMETRILQRLQDTVFPTSPSSQQDIVAPEEQAVSADLPKLESSKTKSSSSEESTTLDHEDKVIPASQDRAKADTQLSGGTVIPETNDNNPERVSETQAPLLDADEEDPMSEDRRREISQLINDAGFRKEVDPSIGESAQKPPSVPSSSPSRQLEETLKEAASAASHPNPQLSSFSNPSQEVSQATSHSSMSVDSQPIILEPFHCFSDDVEEPSEDAVAYPALDLPPSDIGSTHSGRQPDPDFSIDLGNTSHDRLDSVGEASFSAPRAKTPPAAKAEKKPQKVSPAKSDSSANSFPSLSEIFLTASTQATQATQSSTSQAAISSALKARKSDVASDLEYEEAMRKLDEGGPCSDSETELPNLKAKRSPDHARSLLKKPIEKPTIKRAIVKDDVVKSSTCSRPIRATRTSASFTIPAGSQVVSLISSSPEPEVEENYADDDVDESYEADSFPSEQDSPGWGEKGRSRRGGSIPLSALLSSKGGGTNVPKRLASSQGGKLGRTSATTSHKQNKKKTTTRGW
ncbi:hypothetical protein V8F33_007375 [Rhypophila sp. PSN 637]